MPLYRDLLDPSRLILTSLATLEQMKDSNQAACSFLFSVFLLLALMPLC
jgi:hypothetical protein